MKKLVVSCKTSDQVFDDFKRAAKKTMKGKSPKERRFEVSFDNKADFNKFVRNIPILSAIIVCKPRSVYELAKYTGVDVSNLNKTIQFFEEIGVIKVKVTQVGGRTSKQPHVEFEEVTFKLAA